MKGDGEPRSVGASNSNCTTAKHWERLILLYWTMIDDFLVHRRGRLRRKSKGGWGEPRGSDTQTEGRYRHLVVYGRKTSLCCTCNASDVNE